MNHRLTLALTFWAIGSLACSKLEPTPNPTHVDADEDLAVKDMDEYAVVESFEVDARPGVNLANGTAVQLVRLAEFEEALKRFPVEESDVDSAPMIGDARVDLRPFQTGIRNQNPRGTWIVFANVAGSSDRRTSTASWTSITRPGCTGQSTASPTRGSGRSSATTDRPSESTRRSPAGISLSISSR